MIFAWNILRSTNNKTGSSDWRTHGIKIIYQQLLIIILFQFSKKIRNKFNLCVDGGLTQKNINKIDCEKIVSASNVFKNENPKKQITNLQKLLNN